MKALRSLIQPGGFWYATDPEMEKNIGRKVAFKVKPGQGTKHRETHIIYGVQKIHDGSLAYRVQTDDNDFGFPARPEDLIWLDLTKEDK